MDVIPNITNETKQKLNPTKTEDSSRDTAKVQALLRNQQTTTSNKNSPQRDTGTKDVRTVLYYFFEKTLTTMNHNDSDDDDVGHCSNHSVCP